MHHNWMNEDGEPFMTAAELRLEAELDAQSAEERWAEAWLDDDFEPDEALEEEADEDDWHVAEDAHLDGMWEE